MIKSSEQQNATENVIIFGGTGFLGLILAKHLRQNGFNPVLIARNKPQAAIDFTYVKWDALTPGAWVEQLQDAKAIVNLAGKSVDCIKTPDNCDLILRSRVDSTKTIGKACAMVSNPPKIWIQMATAHIYGDPPAQVCTEDSTTGYGLAPFVGKAWEEAFRSAKPKGVRGVILRTGFVLGRNGGALQRLKKLVALGLGGHAGHGKQGMSWIHIFDMNEIMHQAIIQEQFEGIYIASAPNPVSNREFMRSLRRIMKIPVGISMPEPLTRFGAKYVLRTDPELALFGRYVVSERLEKEGFQFRFPRLEEALKDLIGN